MGKRFCFATDLRGKRNYTMKLILSLPLLLLIPGYLLLRASRGSAPPAARLARRGWLQAVVASIVVNSWAGLVLLECGRFSLTTLLIALGVLSALVLVIFRPILRSHTPRPCRGALRPPYEEGNPGFRGVDREPRADYSAGFSLRLSPCKDGDRASGEGTGAGSLRAAWPLALVLCAFAAACLWAGPSEYVFGGWDSGEYVNMGASFAEKGRIVYRDNFFASVPLRDRPLFTDGGRRYIGFNLTSLDDAIVGPKFMHLYPLWLALAMKLSGLRAALSLNIAFSLVSIALCWRIALALRGRGAAFAAAAFMAASGIELWFSRSQCAEPLAQLFFLAAVIFWVLWRDGRGRIYAPLSAACLGMMFLTKFDTILVFPLAAAALLMTEWKEGEGAFLLVLLAALLHLLAHMIWWDMPYARAILANLPAPLRGKGMIMIPVGLLASIALVPVFRKSGIRAFSPARLPLAARCVAGAGGLALAVALWASPGTGSLAAFGGLMGAGLLWWGIAALAWSWCDGVRADRSLLWCPAVGALAVFSLSLVGERGLYPWSARRFLPVAVPALCVFAGCFAAEVASRIPRRWRAALAGGLSVLALAPVFQFPFLLTARDYPGAARFLPRFAAATEGYDILVVEQVKLAVPLDFLCRRNVLLFKDTEQTIADCDRVEALIERWIAQGKRVAYVTSGPAIHGKRVAFVEKASCTLPTSVLPLGHGEMPRGEVPVRIAVRVLEARPLSAEPAAREARYDFGYHCFGLEEGFSGPRRVGPGGAVGRWTKPRAALILPWAGGGSGGEIIITAAGGRRPRPIEVLVGGTRVGAFDVAGSAMEYALLFPPGLLPGEKRARIELRSESGIFLERVTIRTDL